MDLSRKNIETDAIEFLGILKSLKKKVHRLHLLQLKQENCNIMLYKQQRSVSVNFEEKIVNILKTNKGHINNRLIKQLGIPTIYLTRLVNKGLIVRVERGIYVLPDIIEDEFYINSLKYNNIVYSRKTALYLNKLANKSIRSIDANVPLNYSNANIKALKIYRVNDVTYQTGITKVITPYGNEVKAYDKERCICDLFVLDIYDNEEIRFAINEYRKERIDYEKLYNYAESLKVLDRVKTIFEVLL